MAGELPNRATMSSLKATHEAFRITTAIIADRRIEFGKVRCGKCGEEMSVEGVDPFVESSVRCPACGEENALPHQTFVELRERRRELELRRAREGYREEEFGPTLPYSPPLPHVAPAPSFVQVSSGDRRRDGVFFFFALVSVLAALSAIALLCEYL